MTRTRLVAALVLDVMGALPVLAGESYDVSGSTGNLYYEYALDIPAARGRYQPRLFLRYGGKQGDIGSNGATWGIPPVPVIFYDYVNPPYDGQLVHWYVDHENPDRILLPSPRDGSGHYNTDVEDRYMDFWQLDPTAWCARDGAGNVYRFESPSAGGGGQYGLRQVVDPDGNVTRFTYRDINQVSSIQYNIFGNQPAAPIDCRSVTGEFATELAIEYSNLGLVQNIRVKNKCPVSSTCPTGEVTVRRYAFAYVPITWTWYYNDSWSEVITINVLGSITEFGGEDGIARPPMAFEYGQYGNDRDTLVRQAHLTKVITPLGAQRAIAWKDSSQFGDTAAHSYPVVRSITTTGPGLASHSVEYGYAGVMPPGSAYWVQSYFPPIEFRGFSESWVTDSTTGIVKHSWWETASHAFLGTEARVEYGTRMTPDSFPTLTSYTPPTSAVFQTEVFENVARPITAAGATPTCTPLQTIAGQPGNYATEVPATSYPVLGFQQREQQSRQVDAVQLSSLRSSACADVDTWGHLGKVSVDPDTNYAGDEYVENASFEVAFDPAANCRDCVRERTRTDPTKAAPNDRLEATYFSYGPTFQVTATYRQAGAVLNPTSHLGTSYYPRVTSSVPNSDGTLDSRTEGAVTTTYTYDAYRLRPATVSVADANSTLVTTTFYDDQGRPYSVSGPAVTGRSDPVLVRYFTYDALGRTRIISQQPMSGSQVNA